MNLMLIIGVTTMLVIGVLIMLINGLKESIARKMLIVILGSALIVSFYSFILLIK